MKYDEAKSSGVQKNGQTGKKVFINRDADYDTALERIREELYGTTNNESMFCGEYGGNCFRAIRGKLGRFSKAEKHIFTTPE